MPYRPATRLSLGTPRLELRCAATVELARAEVHNRFLFARLLDAVVPSQWPPPLNDRNSQRYHLEQLTTHPEAAGWWCWYFLRAAAGPTPRTAIGNGGFKGPPANGLVDLGYSLLPEFQHHGYATEAVRALINWAFDHPQVQGIAAETLPELAPSIRVLERTGFVRTGSGTEPGTIRYELRRVFTGVPVPASRL